MQAGRVPVAVLHREFRYLIPAGIEFVSSRPLGHQQHVGIRDATRCRRSDVSEEGFDLGQVIGASDDKLELCVIVVDECAECIEGDAPFFMTVCPLAIALGVFFGGGCAGGEFRADACQIDGGVTVDGTVGFNGSVVAEIVELLEERDRVIVDKRLTTS